MPLWCDFSWEGVVCASVVCFQMCFQLGGGLLCSCGVFPAGRGSSVPVWCVSSWEGSSVPVWCVSSWEVVVCASVVCFQLGGGRLCSCGVLPALRGSSVSVWCFLGLFIR